MSVQLECLYLKDNILSRSEQYQALLFIDNSKSSNRERSGLVGKLGWLANRTLTTWHSVSWRSWRGHSAWKEHFHVFAILALAIEFA